MEYLIHILIIAGIYSILATSLNLMVGYTGLPAFGHMAFACAGAYASALLTLKIGLPPSLALVIGACLAAILGFVVGLFSLRFHGDFFALVTFGFGVIVFSVANNWITLTRGPMGIPGIPPLFLTEGKSIGITTLAVVVVLVVLTLLIILRLVRSPFGRVCQGIRDDELVVECLGRKVDRQKIAVFVIGALFAGLAGGLYAHYASFIDPSSFTPMESIAVLVMVVFGGMGSVSGGFVGACLLVLLPECLRLLGLPGSVAGPVRQILYGCLLILLMVFRPRGLVGRFGFR